MEVDLDANNNSTDKKGYSLRPRSAPKTTEEDEIVEEVRSSKPRGRVQKTSKQKTLPLSKYRRKTANARERSRMREINEAFETLRRSIPLISTKCDNPSEKNTKISTLRLAMKYITVLSSALRESDGESDKESIFSEYSLATPEYLEAFTPTSTSDNSEFSESFFVTNINQERSSNCVSPFSSSSSYLFDIPSPTRLATKFQPPLGKMGFSSVISVHNVVSEENQRTAQILSDVSAPVDETAPSHPLSRLTSIEEINLIEPTPVFNPTSTLEPDLRYTSLTPITIQLQSTSVLQDWDDINLSRVDLDELLRT